MCVWGGGGHWAVEQGPLCGRVQFTMCVYWVPTSSVYIVTLLSVVQWWRCQHHWLPSHCVVLLPQQPPKAAHCDSVRARVEHRGPLGIGERQVQWPQQPLRGRSASASCHSHAVKLAQGAKGDGVGACHGSSHVSAHAVVH